MPSDFNESIVQTIFEQRENEERHANYESEFSFYHAVQHGELETVKAMQIPLGSGQMGTLSKNPVNNLKYHFIISVAMITRFCIESGLSPEYAYTLSDLYIQRADELITTDAIQKLHVEMILDYTRKMQQLKKDKTYSRHIALALDYIYAHLQEPFTVDSVARAVNLNPSYLSALFKKEMNISLSSYVRTERIKMAENLLKYSDYSAIDICNYLCFSSHSHFIKVFKEQTGYTPKEYRDRFFRHSWGDL